MERKKHKEGKRKGGGKGWKKRGQLRRTGQMPVNQAGSEATAHGHPQLALLSSPLAHTNRPGSMHSPEGPGCKPSRHFQISLGRRHCAWDEQRRRGGIAPHRTVLSP